VHCGGGGGEDYELWKERQVNRRAGEEYFLWKERSGRMMTKMEDEAIQEELIAWHERMA
jgi:hypothetical protein